MWLIIRNLEPNSVILISVNLFKHAMPTTHVVHLVNIAEQLQSRVQTILSQFKSCSVVLYWLVLMEELAKTAVSKKSN